MGGFLEGRGTGGGWGHNSVVRGAEGDGWLARRARYGGGGGHKSVVRGGRRGMGGLPEGRGTGGGGHNSVVRGAEGGGWLARRARYRGGRA